MRLPIISQSFKRHFGSSWMRHAGVLIHGPHSPMPDCVRSCIHLGPEHLFRPRCCGKKREGKLRSAEHSTPVARLCNPHPRFFVRHPEGRDGISPTHCYSPLTEITPAVRASFRLKSVWDKGLVYRIKHWNEPLNSSSKPRLFSGLFVQVSLLKYFPPSLR